MKTVKEIHEQFENTNLQNIFNVTENYKSDSRVSVQKLITRYEKKYLDYQNEIQRIKNLLSFELEYLNKGMDYIAGIDEVGRGPLAGPVAAACVVFSKDFFLSILNDDTKIIDAFLNINDSKKVNEQRREELYDEIYNNALSVSIGMVENDRIDKINILNATYEAMEIAVSKAKNIPDILLIDALRLHKINILQHPIIGGDGKSFSIAAASIVAKVSRDRLMTGYALEYPEYDFENNKGYGTKKHIEAIKIHGLTQIHRTSFTKNLF